MKLKIFMIFTIGILCSACSSKDAFYRSMYNYTQDDNFCISSRECRHKRSHSNDYNNKQKMTYDEYKKTIEKIIE